MSQSMRVALATLLCVFVVLAYGTAVFGDVVAGEVIFFITISFAVFPLLLAVSLCLIFDGTN